MKKGSEILFFLITLILVYTANSMHEEALSITGDPLTTTFDPQNPQNFDWQHGDLSSVSSDRLDFDRISQFNREKDLSVDQVTFQRSDGTYNIDKVDIQKLSENVRNEALQKLGRTNEQVETQAHQPTQVTTLDDGFFLDYIDFLKIGEVSIHAGNGVSYRGNRFTIDSATKIEIKDGLLTDVLSFVGNAVEFSVGKAEDVVNGCVTARGVENSDFRITDRAIEIMPKQGVSFQISDCNFAQSNFESLSDAASIEIEKKQNPNYKVKEGQLECISIDSKDRVEANNFASVDYGNSCFSCMVIDPIGTYWYNDNELKKDFGINIPENALPFKLCLRKNELQEFDDFDGLINFVDKFVVLNKIVNYLKYPFQNNEPASLLMNNMFSDLNDFNANFELDDDFNFVNRVLIKTNDNPDNNAIINNENNNFLNNGNNNLINNANLNIGTINEKTTTKPSNYYEIKEKTINNNVHRLLKINFRLNDDDLTQNRIFFYRTNYFEPVINIESNILTQNNGENLIVALTPNHEKISQIVN